MPKANGRASKEGTRFRLYPYAPFLDPGRGPETVELSPPAGSLGPGPADERMYVSDPIGKARPYGDAPETGLSLPPWQGRRRRPALPDAEGHFDHIDPHSPQFEAAHLYGVVRFTLDVWERYFGHQIEWHFHDHFDRLELSLLRNFENATMGYGFLEAGIDRDASGDVFPFSLSFDVIAHEVGHCIVYSQIGVPSPDSPLAEYLGFHESAADITALIALLHFESVIQDLLETTSGNLYTYNVLNRFGELSHSSQIRLAANSSTLGDFATGWTGEHELSEPLTGALFDILIDIFHDYLVEAGAIAATVEDLSDRLETSSDYHRVIQPHFDDAYDNAPGTFYQALSDARDTLGIYLAECWHRLDPQAITYEAVGWHLLAVDQEITGGLFGPEIAANFAKRLIGSVQIGPRRSSSSARADHSASVRTLTPHAAGTSTTSFRRSDRRLPYRLRRKLALNNSWW